MASSKIQLSSWGPVLSVPLLSFTAHLGLLLFPEISLGSFFTSSLLSLPAHTAKHETSSSWGTHVTEYRQRFWGVVETRIQQPFRSASNLQMEEFGSYMNLAVSFLFVAKLGTLLKIRQEERKKKSFRNVKADSACESELVMAAQGSCCWGSSSSPSSLPSSI